MRFRHPSLGQVWTFLAVALPALVSLLAPMPAVDLAYQLRAGADILGGHGIPAADTWTFTVAGTPWLDQQWLAQAILAATFQVAGWTGLAILRAALVGLTFGLLLATIRAAWSIASVRAGGSAIASSARTATLVSLAFLVVAMPALALRPQLFGVVLFVATLLILVERSRHPRRLWLVPVFAALWANLHGSFPLVIVLIGLAWVDEVALLRLPTPPGHARVPLPQRLRGSTGLALIGAFAAVATLVNPFGIDVWSYVANLARDPEITSQVSEWRPPSPLDPAGAIFYLSLMLLVGVLAFRFRADRGRPASRFWAPIAAVAVFGVLGAVTGRGLAWWAIVAPVAMVQLQPGLRLADLRVPALPQLRLRARTARAASESEARRSYLNTWLVAVLGLAAVVLLPPLRDTGPAGVPNGTLSFAPQGVAAELRTLLAAGTLQPGDRVWAPQTWGSWLEYSVPELSYAVDSRIELFPASVWSDARDVATGAEGVSAVLDRHAVDAVAVEWTQEGLYDAMFEAPGWLMCAWPEQEGWIWIRAGADLSPQPGCYGR